MAHCALIDSVISLCGIGPSDEEIIHTPALITRFITPWRATGSKGDTVELRLDWPVTVSSGSVRIASCCAGGACTAVISTSGTVFTFGALSSGRLGSILFDELKQWTLFFFRYRRPHNGGDYQLRPKAVRLDFPVESVACGAAHMLCVGVNGKLWGWGDNSAGQLGQGHLVDEYTPVRIHHTSHGSAWGASVGACGGNSAAVDRVGRLYVWGRMMTYLAGSATTDRYAIIARTFGIRKIVFPWAWPRQIRGVEGSGVRVRTAECRKDAVVFTTTDDVVYEWKLAPGEVARRGTMANMDIIATDDESPSDDEGGLEERIGDGVVRLVQFPLARNIMVSCGPEHTVVAAHLGHRALLDYGKCLLEGRRPLPYADSLLAGVPVHTALLRHRLSPSAFLGVIQPQLERINHEGDVLLSVVEDYRANSLAKAGGSAQSESTAERSERPSRVECLIDSILGDEGDAQDHLGEILKDCMLKTLLKDCRCFGQFGFVFCCRSFP